jgi:hypothetical protein
MNSKNSAFCISHSAFHETAPAGHWRGVFFDGPESGQDREGDEIPVWLVYVGDEDAEPVDTVYTCYNFAAAEKLAHAIARDRQLQLIHEATTA